MAPSNRLPGELVLNTPTNGNAPSRPYGTFAEIGRTGLRRYGGYVYEEFLPKLQGNRAIQVFEEMRTNDSTVAAILFAIEMLIRQVEWRVDPGGDSAEDQEAAEFVESCLYDMAQSWEETVSDILTMLPFGFCWMEQVYKRREGPKGQNRSKHSDGKIGWRKWAIRAQTTRWKWEFDAEGGILGMWQSAAPTFTPVFIPIEKSLLFRPRLAKNNPEGFSILRSAYRSWYFLKRAQEIEGIGMERDLAGLPVIECPAEITMPSAPADQQAVYAALKTLVQNIRRDQQEGIVMPQAYDPETKQPLYKLSLLTSGGKREFDVDAVIQRYQTDICRSVLAEFLMLGSTETGSWALASDKTRLFSTAIGTWLQQVAGPVNQYAIPRLLELNGYSDAVRETPPTLCYGDIEKPDLGVLGDFIQKLAAAGVPLFPDPKAENILRGYAGLPEMTEDEIAAREDAVAPAVVGNLGPDGQPVAAPPVAGAEGEAARAAAGDPNAAVQDTALNGAQAQALLVIVQEVAANRLPASAAAAMIAAAFPLITPEQTQRILAGVQGFAPEPSPTETPPKA